eukprot:m.340877 g.340877  ORF g.340877 m.340877 type:complete len:218 (+) comp19612_c0_seq1:162-815(+)
MKMNTVPLFVFLFAYNIARSWACSPIFGWQPPTIEEQAQRASVVIEGVIIGLNTSANSRVQDDTATVRVKTYYAGCGPSIVTVSGFSHSAACGVSAEMNGTYFLYLCANEVGGGYHLNEFDIHTGAIQIREGTHYDNSKEVKKKTTSVTGAGAAPDACTEPSVPRQCGKPGVNTTESPSDGVSTTVTTKTSEGGGASIISPRAAVAFVLIFHLLSYL